MVEPRPREQRSQERLRSNKILFDELVDHAVRAAETSVQTAVSIAQAAAHLAWYDHIGSVRADRLESLLVDLGRSAEPRREAPRRGPVGRVVHVITEAHPVGGHTRLIWRWMRADAGRIHDVILTQQGSNPVPEALRSAATSTGGSCTALASGSWLDMAAELRRHCSTADLVVLDVHPFDALPLIALADPRGIPPVALLDHADHVFWLGARIVDVLISLRRSGADFALRRRGISPLDIAWLPSPLEVAPAADRDAVREAIEMPADAVVLLTVAAPYKYEPVDANSFVDMVGDLLLAHPTAVLIAVGPSPGGAWQQLARLTGGRVLATGYQEDISAFHAVADVYLDSFPIMSPTSFLEAGALGVPVLTFSPDAGAGPLVADDFGADRAVLRATSRAQWSETASALIDDAALRALYGEAMRSSVTSQHSGPGWTRVLEEMYDRVATAPEERRPLVPAVDAPSDEAHDGFLLTVHERSGMTSSVDALLERHGAPPLEQLRGPQS